MGFHLSRSGFPATPASSLPSLAIQVWSRPALHRRCLPAGPVVGSQSWSYHLPWFSAFGTEEREEYIGQHARAFTQASDLAWNPQTRLSCQGTRTNIPQPYIAVKREEGRVPP